MTDQQTRHDEVRKPGCRGKRHTPSNESWRLGCRCDGTIVAHKQWLKTHPQSMKASVDENGRCTAARHDSTKAYRYAGCRCPESVRLYEIRRKRQADARKMQVDREYSALFGAEARRAKRLTGGRLEADPRRTWRGGNMAVDRNGMFWLMRARPDSPTKGEKLAALARFDADPPWIPGPGWFSKPRRACSADLARMLGCSEVTVARLRRERVRLREERHLRRLADATWRAAYTAAGADRAKERLRG